jgi:hypothetical protein
VQADLYRQKPAWSLYRKQTPVPTGMSRRPPPYRSMTAPTLHVVPSQPEAASYRDLEPGRSARVYTTGPDWRTPKKFAHWYDGATRVER